MGSEYKKECKELDEKQLPVARRDDVSEIADKWGEEKLTPEGAATLNITSPLSHVEMRQAKVLEEPPTADIT